MEGLESLIMAIEELGRKVERMESTLNQMNAEALQSQVLPAEQRRSEDIAEVLQSQVIPARQTRIEDIPMGFSRTGEESEKSVVVFEEGEFSFEDVLDRKEEEVLFASCRLIKIYKIRTYDEEIRMGQLDITKFEDALSREKRSDLKSIQKEQAQDLCNQWQTKINALAGVEEIPFKPYDEGELDKIKESYGVDLYRMIRKGFREMRVASRTGVFKKPWNYREGREATLIEIMIMVQNWNRRLRTPIRREY